MTMAKIFSNISGKYVTVKCSLLIINIIDATQKGPNFYNFNKFVCI